MDQLLLKIDALEGDSNFLGGAVLAFSESNMKEFKRLEKFMNTYTASEATVVKLKDRIAFQVNGTKQIHRGYFLFNGIS